MLDKYPLMALSIEQQAYVKQLNNALGTDQFLLEGVSCELCASLENKVLFTRDRYEGCCNNVS